jgi:hypothetical protein
MCTFFVNRTGNGETRLEMGLLLANLEIFGETGELENVSAGGMPQQTGFAALDN